MKEFKLYSHNTAYEKKSFSDKISDFLSERWELVGAPHIHYYIHNDYQAKGLTDQVIYKQALLREKEQE